MDLLGEAKDFIVSIGTETLKEKGEKAYNEKKIKSDLIDYINSIENLIADFRESLYGDIEKREQRKESILECLCSYAKADSYEKKQYVKNIFLNAYNIIQNYYDRCIVKLENVYLANKIVDDVHKDIKKCLELVNSLPNDASPVQNLSPNISMVQHGDKNQQIGQVSNLIINND